MSIFFKYSLRFCLVLLLALLISLGAMGTLLAGPPGGTPADALIVDKQLHTIAPQSAIWYRFEYLGDDSQITVKMPNGAKGPTFELYTPEQVNIWWKADPIGMSNDDGEDHIWFGNFNTSGVYYLKVINEHPYAATYQLLVEGKGTLAGKTTLPTAQTAPQAVSPMKNIDPYQAVKFDAQQHTVPANTALWYRMDYVGIDTPFFVKLAKSAKSGLQFEIYMNEQIATWWKTDPVGMGTVDGDDLLWSGYMQSDLTHYLRVINRTDAPLNFQFEMQTMAGPR